MSWNDFIMLKEKDVHFREPCNKMDIFQVQNNLILTNTGSEMHLWHCTKHNRQKRVMLVKKLHENINLMSQKERGTVSVEYSMYFESNMHYVTTRLKWTEIAWWYVKFGSLHFKEPDNLKLSKTIGTLNNSYLKRIESLHVPKLWSRLTEVKLEEFLPH